LISNERKKKRNKHTNSHHQIVHRCRNECQKVAPHKKTPTAFFIFLSALSIQNIKKTTDVFIF
jgi:hypothetical protein